MTKISVFVHDLSRNPIVRAAPIARALQRAGYSVEVLGLLPPGRKIFSPYRGSFKYITQRTDWRPLSVVKSAYRLGGAASGELIYAFKPLWTTLFPALIASRHGVKRPLMLDVEDEVLFTRKGSLAVSLVTEPIIGWGDMRTSKYSLLIHPFVSFANVITVSSQRLQRRYGGVRILHGPSVREIEIRRAALTRRFRGSVRSRFGLCDGKVIVGFAGTPHKHKGLSDVVQALKGEGLSDVHLALAGPEDHPVFRCAKRRLGSRCHLVGWLEYTEMPTFICAIDIVPVMQRRNRITEAQVPAKVLEAMAYRRVVVGTTVGDLPLLLGRNSGAPRGWLVEPRSVDGLQRVLRRIIRNHREARLRARRAERFVAHRASVEANVPRLESLVGTAMAGAA